MPNSSGPSELLRKPLKRTHTDANDSPLKRPRLTRADDGVDKSRTLGFPKTLALASLYRKQEVPKPDVCFSFGKSSINAHSVVLKDHGAFQGMFSEAFFKPGNTIDITDASFESFYLLLKLIYNDKPYANMLNSEVMLDTAIGAYVLTDKYLLNAFKTPLIKFIRKRIGPENVFKMLEFNAIYNIEEIKEKCWLLIEIRTEHCLQSSQNDFVKISWNTLCDFLDNGRLNIKEYDLFQAILKWCDYQKNTTMKRSTLEEVIGVAVYKIRFPLMSCTQLIKVKESGILKPMLFKSLAGQCYCELGKTQVPTTENISSAIFNSTPRKRICYCWKLHRTCHCLISRHRNMTTSSTGKNNCIRCGRKKVFDQVTATWHCPLKPPQAGSQRCDCQKYNNCPESYRSLLKKNCACQQEKVVDLSFLF